MSSVPPRIEELVETFDRNIEAYRSQQYNEAQLRREFIDPFFEELGWDVTNKQGYAQAYKEVIHEDAVKVGTATKAPDYSFRIGGTRKFFLEAKKPSIDIKGDPHPAYQLRRYAWSAKLPLSILTDFEEFAVYDCQTRPKQTDKASTARIMYYTYKDYIKKWGEIANIFSKDSILKGSFDKFAVSPKAKRGTTTVDKEFLTDLEKWRKDLARIIALRNTTLSAHEVNFSVQRTIDRIIFLRMAEDRGIEDYGQLLKISTGSRTYPRLCEVFEKADHKYNSGLFYFQKERGRPENPDELTLNLTIDDAPLSYILHSLYYPLCPYEFSVLPPEILGNVYEQFLGSVIQVSSGRRTKVEPKPEVKKAGGIYYTPDYIVDYIVKNTVGKLCENKTPKDISKLKILDPACGSGSFLLGAYTYLLNYHRDWYVDNKPKNYTKQIYQGRGGQWFLTIAEKKKILLNNIFGVDIDSQAVEVTKLSLLLKVLEGESQETIENQMRLFRERALPDLGYNIKCGNSLIAPDFFDHSDNDASDDALRQKINAFDWKTEFPQIFSSKISGFDAVIGNPPYGFRQIHSKLIKPYLKSHYVSSIGSFENYFLFYETSLKKLSKNGYHGFIVPVTWLTIPSATSLRRFVLENYSIEFITWLPEFVFKNAKVNTLVSIIRNSKPNVMKVLISDVNNPSNNQGLKIELDQSNFRSGGYEIRIFESTNETEILQKIESNCVYLNSLTHPCSGYNPYEVGKGKSPDGKPHTLETIKVRPYHSDKKLSKDWKPEIVGRDLGRYFLLWPKKRFIKYGPWLAAPRESSNFFGPRILVQEITGGTEHRIIAAFCNKEIYHSRDVIPIKCNSKWPNPLFLLGILNSWLITWRHHRRSPKAKKALFPKVLVGDLKKIPVPKLLESNPSDKAKHNKMVKLVDRMLDLHKKLAKAKVPAEKTQIQRQITTTDKQIDNLVYELYNLTPDEIAIVEGNDYG